MASADARRQPVSPFETRQRSARGLSGNGCFDPQNEIYFAGANGEPPVKATFFGAGPSSSRGTICGRATRVQQASFGNCSRPKFPGPLPTTSARDAADPQIQTRHYNSAPDSRPANETDTRPSLFALTTPRAAGGSPCSTPSPGRPSPPTESTVTARAPPRSLARCERAVYFFPHPLFGSQRSGSPRVPAKRKAESTPRSCSIF